VCRDEEFNDYLCRENGSKPHDERLRRVSSLVRLLARIIGQQIPGISSFGYMPSRTRVLFRLLKLHPNVYGNSETR